MPPLSLLSPCNLNLIKQIETKIQRKLNGIDNYLEITYLKKIETIWVQR